MESLGENAEKVSDSIEDVSNEISNIDKGGNISKISSKFDYLKNKKLSTMRITVTPENRIVVF